MHKDPTIGQLICQKHANQLPTPWYKINLVLEDETSEMNALIIGKSGEKLFWHNMQRFSAQSKTGGRDFIQIGGFGAFLASMLSCLTFVWVMVI
ncbi:hypothetical protein C1H46_023317 [Malus baccata]|uniref:Uncharacterized protein n=1 Tax=Malus baccata TaxID=106549 RepID=A0A540LX57_MALBA|nr:hypothetical protein C1H46_023317 [Malus baccata]